jgi:phospholipid/cholesterol/gamma-HCH transport system permease protein
MADEAARLTLTAEGGGRVLRLAGRLELARVGALRADLAAVPADGPLTVDLAGVRGLDTAGAWALARLAARLAAAGHDVRWQGARADHAALLDTVTRALPDDTPAPAAHTGIRALLERIGRATVSGLSFGAELLAMLGLFVATLGRALRHPREFRLTSLVHHCHEVGIKAVPIVALMAFLIGIVLAFQGSTQLRQFGAEVFVVDLIAISILRELGILLTAIIVAGRTASAFTAAIGSMKMREEVDAMRTLGLDPAQALFVPRILSLLIVLPILGLIANVAGLTGGMLMSWVELGISPALFQARLAEGTSIDHVMVGLVKAPVFALIIGVVGCHAGMRVESNAESLGRNTSSAVVTAIFAVIVADAAFSVFFAQIGI